MTALTEYVIIDHLQRQAYIIRDSNTGMCALINWDGRFLGRVRKSTLDKFIHRLHASKDRDWGHVKYILNLEGRS